MGRTHLPYIAFRTTLAEPCTVAAPKVTNRLHSLFGAIWKKVLLLSISPLVSRNYTELGGQHDCDLERQRSVGYLDLRTKAIATATKTSIAALVNAIV